MIQIMDDRNTDTSHMKALHAGVGVTGERVFGR